LVIRRISSIFDAYTESAIAVEIVSVVTWLMEIFEKKQIQLKTGVIF